MTVQYIVIVPLKAIFNILARIFFIPMDFKRSSVIGLHLAGKKKSVIESELKNLNVSRKFIYRTIKRYEETGTTNKRSNGGPKKTATSPAMIRRVRARIRRNPRRSAKKMAKDLDISDRSLRRILKNDLRVKPYKIQKCHELTPKQKKVRLERVKGLIQLHASGGTPNTVFSDEKKFIVEQFVNKQNDRIWLQQKSSENLDIRLATRRQAPAQLMVWAAVTATGRSPLVIMEPNVKINAKVYQEKVLEGVLKPWAQKHFGSEPFTFQQDSAPSHKARINQQWLRENVPHFISTEQWPASSPDLNPLDFSIWSILEAKVCQKKHESLESLKASLHREWKAIPQEHLRAACEAFVDRLLAVKRAKGGHIEN